MNSPSRKPAAVRPSAKSPQPLARPLSRRLFAYATMAGAGVAAGTRAAEAEVVYTPTHSNIHFNYPLDLNNDGIPDFRILSSSLSGISYLGVSPIPKGNKIAASVLIRTCSGIGPVTAAALNAGAEIGPGVSFQRSANCMAAGFSGLNYGPWADVKSGYLGFAFVIGGQVHYGWARLYVNQFYCRGCQARLEGYAYETVAGKAIRAGDEGKGADEASVAPGSLGMLALGAPGLDLWKRPKNELAKQ